MRYQLEGGFRDFVVERDGVQVAELVKRGMSEKASAVIAGEPWQFGKAAGGLRTAVSDTSDQTFTARRASFWRGAWEIECGDTTYRLNPVGFSSSTYEVLRNGAVIGTSAKARFWTNRPCLELPDDVSAPEAIFLLWIAFLMRARASATSAAVSS